MPDERIAAVLARAAKDRAFFDALMADRASALAACDLTEAERALLMAPARAQLSKMIAQARKRPLVGPVFKVIGGVAAAAVAVGMCIPATTGHSRGPVYELVAQSTLKQIAMAQLRYRDDHGSYVGLDALERANMIEIRRDHPYEYAITADADTFTATARHRTRPDTRPAFQVGPDGEVKPVE